MSFIRIICLLQELFKRVVPHQCLGAVWARRARKVGQGSTVAGSVLATIDQFNRVSLRVIATILKNPDLKTAQRMKILKKWIEIAQVGNRLVISALKIKQHIFFLVSVLLLFIKHLYKVSFLKLFISFLFSFYYKEERLECKHVIKVIVFFNLWLC